jgi:hypothetical protein
MGIRVNYREKSQKIALTIVASIGVIFTQTATHTTLAANLSSESSRPNIIVIVAEDVGFND